MERSLYDPKLGYYSRRLPRADFYTAPQLHPAFAQVLARRLAALCRELRLDRPRVIEAGAGDGALAEQLLPALPAGARYCVVERSAAALALAAARLKPRFARLDCRAGLAELEPGDGIVFSNELVDSFPAHVLQMEGGKVRELYVDDSGREFLGPLSKPQLRAHACRAAAFLGEGQRHAVNLEIAPWLEEVARVLTRGALLTIDYGAKMGAAPNPPRAFYRHSLPDDLSARPGRQDLTASVDFDELIRAGRALGFKLHYYGSLAGFLIEGGIGDFLPTGQSAADVKSRAQVKTLLHPEAMGEVFKVLIQTKEEPRG